MNEPHEYDITIHWRTEVEAESVTAGELTLIRSYLPEILRELTMLAHKDKE